jgi:hypothetical protein
MNVYFVPKTDIQLLAAFLLSVMILNRPNSCTPTIRRNTEVMKLGMSLLLIQPSKVFSLRQLCFFMPTFITKEG